MKLILREDVENLGKKYRLRHQQRERYSTLRDAVVGGVRRLFRPKAAPTTQ